MFSLLIGLFAALLASTGFKYPLGKKALVKLIGTGVAGLTVGLALAQPIPFKEPVDTDEVELAKRALEAAREESSSYVAAFDRCEKDPFAEGCLTLTRLSTPFPAPHLRTVNSTVQMTHVRVDGPPPTPHKNDMLSVSESGGEAYGIFVNAFAYLTAVQVVERGDGRQALLFVANVQSYFGNVRIQVPLCLYWDDSVERYRLIALIDGPMERAPATVPPGEGRPSPTDPLGLSWTFRISTWRRSGEKMTETLEGFGGFRTLFVPEGNAQYLVTSIVTRVTDIDTPTAVEIHAWRLTWKDSEPRIARCRSTERGIAAEVAAGRVSGEFLRSEWEGRVSEVVCDRGRALG